MRACPTRIRAGCSPTGSKTKEYAYLREVSSVPLQQSLRHLQAAYRNFFVKTGDYPRFKSKKNGGAAAYAASAFTWDWDERELTLAKMREPLPIHWSRTLSRQARPSTVTVSLDPSGRWHVSILVEEEVKHLPASPTRSASIWAPNTSPSSAPGRKIPNPRHLNRYQKKLEQAQQTLSRKQKGSNNYRKARLKVAKAYAKVNGLLEATSSTSSRPDSSARTKRWSLKTLRSKT